MKGLFRWEISSTTCENHQLTSSLPRGLHFLVVLLCSAPDWLTTNGPFTLWTNNGGQTFGLFPSQTFLLAPLLGCGPPQVIGAGLQEALGRRYFFMDVVGEVAEDADAVLHRLINDRQLLISVADMKMH